MSIKNQKEKDNCLKRMTDEETLKLNELLSKMIVET
jgi:hypothetical protein